MTTAVMKQWIATVSALSGKGNEAEMLISTPTLDRDKDRVIPTGVDLSNATRNLPVLWMHDYRSIPIGTATAINVTRDGIRARWRWLAGDEFADRVKNAWEQGVIRAASIGFKPLESVRNEEGGYDHLRWELLEFSLVTIGANQDAVRQLKGLGLADSLHDRLSSEITDGIMHHLRHAFDKTIEIEDRDLVDVPLATVDRMIARAMASGLADAVGSAVQRRLDYLRGRVHPEDCRPAQVWGN